MRILRAVVTVAVIGVAATAWAEPPVISFQDGRVTVRATGVPLRVILQEWARQGQTRVVGLEKVAGAPMTIELVDIPEKQALETLLRSIAGYVAAPRLVVTSSSISSYDRLLLLPTSVVSPSPAGGPRAGAFSPSPAQQRPVFPDPIQLANDDDGPADQTRLNEQLFAPAPDDAVPAGAVPGPGGQLRPPPIPGDQAGTPALLEPASSEAAGPLTSPRPGILPAPQPARPRP
jgi:hypothetical protein